MADMMLKQSNGMLRFLVNGVLFATGLLAVLASLKVAHLLAPETMTSLLIWALFA